MFETMLNAKTVTVKMRRIDLCDLLMACTALDTATEADNTKWAKLHDKLEEVLKILTRRTVLIKPKRAQARPRETTYPC